MRFEKCLYICIVNNYKNFTIMTKNTEIIHFDWAAKNVLRDKANFVILEGLVSTILDEPIHIVELLESESNQANPSDKFNRVDVKAKDSRDDIILVEIQLTKELYFLQRILFGVAKTITDHISLGTRYENVKKVYSINIIYFDLGKGSDYLYHGRNQLVGMNTGDTLQVNTKEMDGIRTVGSDKVFPEYYIIRVNQFDSDGDSPLEQWVRYLKDGTVKEGTTVPGLAEAGERLRILMLSDKERKVYEEYLYNMNYQNDVLNTAKLDGKLEGLAEGKKEGIAQGKKEGLEEGKKEGANETNINNALKMKELGIDTDTISKVTGLTKERIQNL